MELFIASHAFKHGLEEESILYAWNNFLRLQHRGSPHEGEVVAVGHDKSGRLIQMVAAEREFGYLIYHAMTPPTERVLIELGLKRR